MSRIFRLKFACLVYRHSSLKWFQHGELNSIADHNFWEQGIFRNFYIPQYCITESRVISAIFTVPNTELLRALRAGFFPQFFQSPIPNLRKQGFFRNFYSPQNRITESRVFSAKFVRLRNWHWHVMDPTRGPKPVIWCGRLRRPQWCHKV